MSSQLRITGTGEPASFQTGGIRPTSPPNFLPSINTLAARTTPITPGRAVVRIVASEETFEDRLKNAASSGDEGTVRSLLESDEFGEMDVKYLTGALKNACQNVHTEVVKALIQSARFNEIERWEVGNILTSLPFQRNYANITKLLIPFADEHSLGSALCLAVTYDPSIVNIPILIEAGRFNDISRYNLVLFLHKAIENNRLGAVQDLLNPRGFGENPPVTVDDLYNPRRFGEISPTKIGSCLSSAIFYGRIDIANTLIEETKRIGRFRDIPEYWINDVLSCCREGGYTSIEGAILDAREEEPYSTQGDGVEFEDQLKNAASSGDERAVRSLLESDEFREMDVKYFTGALRKACKNGHAEVVQVFIQSGRFGEIDKLQPRDILSSVCLERHVDVVKLLIPFVDAEFLGTMLHLYPNIINISFLIETGRFGDVPRVYLGTILSEAARKNRPSDVQDLIDSGRFEEIYPFQLGGSLETALYYGHTDIADKLIKKIKRENFRAIDRDCVDSCLRSCRRHGYVSGELAILNAYVPNKSGQTCAVM